MTRMPETLEKEPSCRKHEPNVIKPTARQLATLSQEDAALLVRVLSEPVEYINHPTFTDRKTQKALFGDDPSAFGPSAMRTAGVPVLAGDVDLDGLEHVKAATLTSQQEQRLFQQFNFARFQVYRILKAAEGRSLPADQMQGLVLWSRIADAAKAQIVQVNMPLVLAMAKRTRQTAVDFNEMISEGNLALLRSVEKFDCSRGFKFSTYACRAILKAFSRVSLKTGRYRSHFPTEFDPALEKSDFLDRKRQDVEESCVDELRSVISGNLAALSDVEQKVIQARFALGAADPEEAKTMTLEEVGEIIGVTKERVRQIQNKALAKLRQTLEHSILTA